MAAYLIRVSEPMPLSKSLEDEGGKADAAADAAEGAASADAEGATESSAGQADGGQEGGGQALYDRGRVVFAESCAHCHSSKLPDDIVGLNEQGCIGPDYLDCWKRFWEHVQTPAFKQQMTEIVLRDDFLDDNFLSSDARVPMYQPLLDWKPQEPITGSVKEQYLERARQRGLMTGALETEICSPIATNAIAGHVWDNFSSQSYKSLPGVGEVELYDPVADTTFQWMTHGGGRGYMRVPSLVSVWSTAPYLHNNEIGTFTGDPSVEGRLAAFDDAIRKMLWPELRPGTIHRTDRVTHLKISPSTLPRIARLALPLRGLLGLGFLVENGTIQVGPIPGPVFEGGRQLRAGTPVNFVANLNAARQDADFGLLGLGRTVLAATEKFKQIHNQNLDEKGASDLLREIVPDLMDKSACPDFIVDRGHYFGTDLSDEDKNALIEYIKTL
ncbi:MAG: hypothetical protein MI919_06320 [Holophagales bacterium]|nr:hypothetical protein [Holophagales bacterium]